jgi:hypothetical protein
MHNDDIDFSLLRCANCAAWTRPAPGGHLGKCRRKRVERLDTEGPESLLDWPRTERGEFCRNWEPIDAAAYGRFLDRLDARDLGFVRAMLAESVADGRAEIVGYTPDGRPCYRSTKFHGMPLTGDVLPIN